MFSGGIASAATALRVAEKHGTDDLVLLFADTMIEDADLYRFVDEAAAAIGGKFVRIADGRTPWQVFHDVRFLGNTRADPCSRILKRELMRRWLDDNCSPHETRIYLGMDWTEQHRFDRALLHWAPWRVEAPMTERPLLYRNDMIALFRDRGIQPPRLYDLGFSHNNCGGGCVKAGQGQFIKLLTALPEVFSEWERQEQVLRDELGDVAILRDRRGGETKPLPLSTLRKRYRSGQPCDLDDIGGCNCMEDPEDTDAR